VWETKAKHEKAAHKIAYPHYRFKPVHNKSKKKVEGALGEYIFVSSIRGTPLLLSKDVVDMGGGGCKWMGS
jgi:hypothetical protein